MHFIVAWEIHDDSINYNLMNKKMLDCFEGYSIVQVLSTLFVVNVSETDQYIKLHDTMLKIAQEHGDKIEFILSPLMSSGQYAGYFEQKKWNSMTEEIYDKPQKGGV